MSIFLSDINVQAERDHTVNPGIVSHFLTVTASLPSRFSGLNHCMNNASQTSFPDHNTKQAT
jgi:hypothetical protein